ALVPGAVHEIEAMKVIAKVEALLLHARLRVDLLLRVHTVAGSEQPNGDLGVVSDRVIEHCVVVPVARKQVRARVPGDCFDGALGAEQDGVDVATLTTHDERALAERPLEHRPGGREVDARVPVKAVSSPPPGLDANDAAAGIAVGSIEVAGDEL